MVACVPPEFGGKTAPMPTIFRFAVVAAVIAGLGFGALYALATLLEPAPREVVVPVPPSRYAQ